MEIKKKLLMTFKTISDKRVSISVDNPRTDLTETEIKTTMDLILSKNIFAPNDEDLVGLVEAKIVETGTTEYDLVL
ncbi:MAG: DUF2922 domain-containing protein [Peptostreptococcaceae bacterium]